MERPKRKSTRLPTFDYSSNGAYFVTICTQNRKRLLSDIDVGQGLAPAEVRLTEYGKIAEEQLRALETRYPMLKIDKYVIMPDHIHLLITIQNYAAGASPCPTLSDVICTYKSLTTRLCKQKRSISKLFQSSFNEHVIRNETDYRETWDYIDRNPYRWAEKYMTDR